MAIGWSREDYDAQYRFRVERRMPGGGPPPAEGRPGVTIHYHRFYMQPIITAMWAKLQPILSIGSTEDVLVVGAGFGWGIEAIIAETSANVVGTDISTYIQAEKGNTEEAELRDAITVVGLDPDTGRGLDIFNFVSDGQVRSTVIVLNEDMSSSASKQAIRAALGGVWPSVVIYENIVDDSWTDQEIIDARNAGNGFGGSQRLIFVY